MSTEVIAEKDTKGSSTKPFSPLVERVKQIRAQIAENVEKADDEKWCVKTGINPWDYYYRDYKNYEALFGLKPSTLTQFLKAKASCGITPFGLDVGADTSCLSSLRIPGVAVGLFDPRGETGKYDDEKCGRFMVTGDVLRLRTWGRIHQMMASLGIKNGFSLILAQPEGGLDKITQNPSVHFRLLQEMWQLLSYKEGMLIVQTRLDGDGLFCVSGASIMEAANWLDHLNQFEGIQASPILNGIQLIKSERAPKLLPALS